MKSNFNTPFVLPDGWELSTVEQLVAQGVLEKPLDGNHGGIHPKASDYVDYGVPFIMASDLGNTRRSSSKIAECGPSHFAQIWVSVLFS